MQTNNETMIASGAADTATGSRMALRGMIWFALAGHLNETAPATLKRQVNAALLGAGRGKGEASTKSTQAQKIAKAVPAIFGAEIASEYETTAHLVQACFNAAEASGAGSVLRLVDWAVNGDPNHKAKLKEQKDAETAQDKEIAAGQETDAIEGASPVEALPLDTLAVAATKSEPDAKTEGSKFELDTMSDQDLAELAEAVAAQIASRAMVQTNVA